MSVIRFPEVSDFMSPTRFGSILERFLNQNLPATDPFASFTPSVDIVEDESKFEVHLAVPGMEKEHFKVEARQGVLTIGGERKWQTEDKTKTYHKMETQYGKFVRSFHLPTGVDTSQIQANYTNGMLVVTLPKPESKTESNTIPVQ
jgi:HSP20 family protein